MVNWCFLSLILIQCGTGNIKGLFMAKESTDFSKILSDLRDWGLNDYDMAKETEIERSKLSKLRTGDRKQPSYDDGVSIMHVYKREKKKAGA